MFSDPIPSDRDNKSENQFSSAGVPAENFRSRLNDNQVTIMIGPPGSGKGTYSKLMASRFGVEHISTGDLLREEIDNETPLGGQVQWYVENREIAPDGLVVAVIADRIARPECQQGFILDGFPRTVEQAEALTTLLEERGVTRPRVIELIVPDDVLVDRIVLRGETSGRVDDTAELARDGIRRYYERTAPVVEYYRSRNGVHSVQALGSIEQVADIVAELFEAE